MSWNSTAADSGVTAEPADIAKSKLRIRKTRSRGPAMSSQDITPTLRSHLGKTSSSGSATEFSTPDLGVLREISNSSSRRRKSSTVALDERLAASKSQSPTPDTQNPQYQEGGGQVLQHDDTSTAQSKSPSNRNPTKSCSRHSRKSIRLSATWNPNGPSGYIESLENQLTESQAQPRSPTSSAVPSSRSLRLRSLSSEVKTFRQEMDRWETRFNERVYDQLEQQEVEISSLRTQLEVMKQASDVADAELQTLHAANAEKSRKLEAKERLCQDLERRLDLMSDLIVTSPSKAVFGDDFDQPLKESRRVGRGPPVTPTCPSWEPSQRLDHTKGLHFTPPSPAQVALPCTDEFESLPTSETWNSPKTRMHSHSSEDTLVASAPVSPTRQRWSIQVLQPSVGDRPRPTRQMRRFFGSTSGPRPLILPSTAYGSPFTVSAPCTAAPTPTRSTTNEFPCEENSSNSAANAERDDGSRRQVDPQFGTPEAQETRPSPGSPTPTAQRGAGIGIYTDNETPSIYARGSVLSGPCMNLHQDLIDLESESDNEEADPLDIHLPLGTQLPETLPVLADRLDDGTGFTKTTAVYDPGGPPQLLQKTRPRPLLFRLIDFLEAAASRTVNVKSPDIKSMLMTTWSRFVLSRPVLGFRWWLIKLLVGDMHKKQRMLTPFDAGLDNPSITKPPKEHDFFNGPKRSDQKPPWPSERTENFSKDSKPNIWDVFRTREKYKHATPPPVAWLKFSLTLLFAVGVAIKDGPGSLLNNARQELDDDDHGSHSHRD